MPSATHVRGVSVNVLVEALGDPATKVTLSLNVMPPVEAVSALVSARVLHKVADAMPEAFVELEVGTQVLSLPLAPKLTGALGIGLPQASLTKAVTSACVPSSSSTLLGLTVHIEVVALGAPGKKVMGALTLTPPMAAVTVVVPAKVPEICMATRPALSVLPERGTAP